MSKSKKKKKNTKKHTPRRTYQNGYDKSLEFTPYDSKKKFSIGELFRKILIWILLIVILIGMSSWIAAMFVR